MSAALVAIRGDETEEGEREREKEREREREWLVRDRETKYIEGGEGERERRRERMASKRQGDLGLLGP